MRRWLDTNDVDRIVFSHVGSGGLDMEQVLDLFGDTAVPVIYAPHWAQAGMSFNVEHIGKQCCLKLWGSERNFFSRQIKWSLDLLLAALGLVLISPLLFVIAIAVKLTSPGPVLFVQDRYGLDGHRFRIYKFRTMTVQEAGDAKGLQQARRNDPRVTLLGGFLRRWSLDELPQLFNVLKGDMSLVGPRPHAVAHNEQYRKLIPGYMQRHGFKPGITGLAQVQGWRGETSSLEAMAKRVESDLSYQRDWSLKLDLKIMIKTLLRLRSDNAY
jgi:putative colanic acid biosynthesis UDP-glucose lipid carrier transferase